MGSRGSDYDSGIKGNQALDWETQNVSRDILAGFSSKSTYRIVPRKKNLEGLKVLGYVNQSENNEKVLEKVYWKVQEVLSAITENDLMTGHGESGNYEHDKLKIVYEHTYNVNINGIVIPIEFYIKAYKGSGGIIMVDSIHPKMHGASTHISWDEHNGFVF